MCAAGMLEFLGAISQDDQVNVVFLAPFWIFSYGTFLLI